MSEQIYFDKVKLINDVILNLYDDEVDLHNRIFDYYNNIFNLIYFERATLMFYYMGSDGKYHKHSSISVNWAAENSELMRRYNESICQCDDTLPLLDRNNPIIFRASEMFDEELRKKEVYWKEYLEPLNCIFSLEGNLQLKSTKGLRGSFAFFRGREKKDFTEEDVSIMKLIQPHLSNILKHYGECADSMEIMAMLQQCSCIGIAILDENCEVIRSSTVFDNLVLQYAEHGLMEKIKSYLSVYIRENHRSEQACLQVKLPERPVFIEITKNVGDNKDGVKQFCCMLYDLSYFSTQTLNQAKDDFSLTEREFDILQDMLRGKSYEEIATERYMSIPTVKKCVVSVYNKMEIHSHKQIFEKLKLF